MKSAALWGLIPHAYVLTTKGRKTGQLHSIPVALVEEDDKKWLVAPYGPVSWVLNARAAGKVTLSRGGRTHMYAVEELSTTAAGPVLKSYLAIATATKPYFEATKDSPVEAFFAEASRHPVFALSRISA
jgi:deazaflavin-dependent oxidoreductase (nitroreductase family)